MLPPAHGEAYGEGGGAPWDAAGVATFASRAILGGRRGVIPAGSRGAGGMAGGIPGGGIPGWYG